MPADSSSPSPAGRSPGRGHWGALRTAIRRGSSSSNNNNSDLALRSSSNGSSSNTVRIAANKMMMGSSTNNNSRRPNLARQMQSFRVSRRQLLRGDSAEIGIPEEEGGDLYKHFRTCASLTRIREELQNALNDDATRKMGFGLNACARPEESSGRLLLHSIGLNNDLITSGGGGTAASLSRVNQFILHELLPVSFVLVC